MKVRQIVRVQILGARREYTYAWTFDPQEGGTPLQPGDRVEIPANQVQEDGSAATVVALGSTYNGEMKFIIRKIEQPPADAGGLWEGFGDGDYA